MNRAAFQAASQAMPPRWQKRHSSRWGLQVMWINGGADEPRGLPSGIASDAAAMAEASLIPLGSPSDVD
jgi:hypothetical protein